jgi:hypothetical protein
MVRLAANRGIYLLSLLSSRRAGMADHGVFSINELFESLLAGNDRQYQVRKPLRRVVYGVRRHHTF